jgi:hypothetical protein
MTPKKQTDVVLVQGNIAGDPEPVDGRPAIEWQNLQEKIDRFALWGADVIGEIESANLRYSRYYPCSVRDTEKAVKAVSSLWKWGDKIREGWNKSIEEYASWRKYCPAEHALKLGELFAVASERILGLRKALETLSIELGRLEALTEGRW